MALRCRYGLTNAVNRARKKGLVHRQAPDLRCYAPSVAFGRIILRSVAGHIVTPHQERYADAEPCQQAGGTASLDRNCARPSAF